MFNKLSNSFKAAVVAVSTLVATASVQAQSILPSTFDADMGAVKTDLNTMIGILVGVIVVILAWRYFKKGAN